MNHQQFREWLPLFLYEELTPEQESLLTAHVNECVSCTNELKRLEKLHRALDQAPAEQPAESLLQEARAELRVALRLERIRISWQDHAKGLFMNWMPYYRIALGTVAVFGFGILGGYFLFNGTPLPPIQVVEKRQPAPAQPQPEIQVANLRFDDADAADGIVSFTFDSVTPMRVQGSIHDEKIQKVLSYALVNEQNPGVRLRAVNALSTPPQGSTDQEVKKSLIIALTTDENPGVRKEALSVLQKFPMDQEIKEAFLHVLAVDDTAGMRVAAIKSLESHQMSDPDVLNVLRDRSKSDDNPYIRMKATQVLQEVTKLQ